MTPQHGHRTSGLGIRAGLRLAGLRQAASALLVVAILAFLVAP